MQFNTPTTKTQMYSVLNDLYYYYRITREPYTDVPLKELDLERLVYTPPTDAELVAFAKEYVAPDQQREIDERRSALSESIKKIQSQIADVESNAEASVAEVESLYESSRLTVERQAVKNGLVSSGVVVDKIAALEEGKNAKIVEIESEKQQKLSTLNASLSALTESLDGVDEYFAEAHEKDVQKKFNELVAEREKKIEETFKYNNGLDEKEQRYKNNIVQVNASFKMRYLEVRMGELTKDQLVEMGYYDDVIKCVCGYYDTLVATVAFQDFKSDTKLPIYLDDYYQNILYMYQVKAGL